MDRQNYLTDDEERQARKLFKAVVQQGHTHRQRIETLMGILVDEFSKEFSEDNKASVEAYLKDTLHYGLQRPIPEQPRKRWCWHRKLYINCWFPELNAYAIGWHCPKCGKKKAR